MRHVNNIATNIWYRDHSRINLPAIYSTPKNHQEPFDTGDQTSVVLFRNGTERI